MDHLPPLHPHYHHHSTMTFILDQIPNTFLSLQRERERELIPPRDSLHFYTPSIQTQHPCSPVSSRHDLNDKQRTATELHRIIIKKHF